MNRDEALMRVRERAGGGAGARDHAGHRDADAERRGGRAVILRGGVEVELDDVRAVVEAMSTDEEDELYMLQWTEMLSWLRMATTVTGRLGGSMRRLPDETPDGETWTVMKDTE
jgi:hypothetical protein|nr:MAG TPA: hypothetical protein [Caudoviricetes sp.]